MIYTHSIKTLIVIYFLEFEQAFIYSIYFIFYITMLSSAAIDKVLNFGCLKKIGTWRKRKLWKTQQSIHTDMALD